MGFEIYRVRSVASNCHALQRVGPLPLGGCGGLFARILPPLAVASDQWNLTSVEILRLAEVGDADSHRLFFNLTPHPSEKVNLLEVVSVSGRTVSTITDAMFHFKVACAGRSLRDITAPSGELILPEWADGPERIDQLRLEGGTRGGTWAWNQAPQAATATVLGK